MKTEPIAKLAKTLLWVIAAPFGSAHAQQSEPFVECIEGQEVEITFQEHTENCEIDTITDTDAFTFNAATGDYVRILASETTTSLIELRLEVLDPNGVELIDLAPGGNIIADLMDLPETGTYRILIREGGSNETGGYMLQLERIFPIFGPPPQLLYDVAVGKALEHRTDMDFFFFEGAQDSRIQMILSETTTSLVELRLEVWDPSRNPIINTAPGGNTAYEDVERYDMAFRL